MKTVTFAEAETNVGNALVSLCVPTFHQYVPLYSYISPMCPLGFMIFIMCPNGFMFFIIVSKWIHVFYSWVHEFYLVDTWVHNFYLCGHLDSCISPYVHIYSFHPEVFPHGIMHLTHVHMNQTLDLCISPHVNLDLCI